MDKEEWLKAIKQLGGLAVNHVCSNTSWDQDNRGTGKEKKKLVMRYIQIDFIQIMFCSMNSTNGAFCRLTHLTLYKFKMLANSCHFSWAVMSWAQGRRIHFSQRRPVRTAFSSPSSVQTPVIQAAWHNMAIWSGPRAPGGWGSRTFQPWSFVSPPFTPHP